MLLSGGTLDEAPAGRWRPKQADPHPLPSGTGYPLRVSEPQDLQTTEPQGSSSLLLHMCTRSHQGPKLGVAGGCIVQLRLLRRPVKQSR